MYRTQTNALKYIPMHSNAFRCIPKHSDTLNCIRMHIGSLNSWNWIRLNCLCLYLCICVYLCMHSNAFKCTQKCSQCIKCMQMHLSALWMHFECTFNALECTLIQWYVRKREESSRELQNYTLKDINVNRRRNESRENFHMLLLSVKTSLTFVSGLLVRS